MPEINSDGKKSPGGVTAPIRANHQYLLTGVSIMDKIENIIKLKKKRFEIIKAITATADLQKKDLLNVEFIKIEKELELTHAHCTGTHIGGKDLPKSNNSKKTPPTEPIKSLQYDLFAHFITNDQVDTSNAVEVWESIPKYFFSPQQIKKLRTESGLAEPYKWNYTYDGIPCMVKIQPALIEQTDGSYKAFFPSITEELIEEALKKILTDQQYGLHDPQSTETWVRFSLSMLEKELTARGRSRNKNQIKHAIEVMSSCIITLYKNNKELWKGSILQDLVTVGREEYLADANSYHIARLPLFISHAIDKLNYRQFNYARLMSCNDQLTRWIYKQLIHRYKQASYSNEYHFMFSSLECNSGLLQQGRAIDNRKKVLRALDELKERQIIHTYDIDNRKDGRSIVDVKYTIKPTQDFIKEQKAANKRMTNNLNQATPQMKRLNKK